MRFNTFDMGEKPQWDIAQCKGYEPRTDLWDTFTRAERSNIESVKIAYLEAWKRRNEREYCTELALVLRDKIGMQRSRDMAYFYEFLYKSITDYVNRNWTGEDLDYFFALTD